jgi:hypothetical protein
MNISKIVNSAFHTANKLTKDIPTTNLVLLVALVCATLTVVMYWVGVLRGSQPEPLGFGSLLAFLATWLGIGNHRFKIKRETDVNYVQAKNGHRKKETEIVNGEKK